MRRQQAYWRSFAHGLMLASLPVLAFAATDYLLAPPAPTDRPLSPARSSTAADQGRQGAAAPVVKRPVADEARKVAHRESAAADPQASLVAAIQRELIRVGCFTDEPAGAWTDQTRVAMRAFNESVNVSLGSDRPDFILLTLLQGHSGKACARPEAPVIEARPVAPPAAQPQVARAAPAPQGVVITSSGGLKAPVPPTWSVSTTRHVAQAQPRDQRDQRADDTGKGEAPAAQQPAAQTARTGIEPLPGRMAVGAAASADAPQATEPAVALTSVDPAAAHRAVTRPRPVQVAKPRASDTAPRKSRLSRTFVELGYSSP